MDFQIIGVSHNTSPVEVRERFAVPESQFAATLHALLKRPGLCEALILCTCNRVEIVVAAEAQGLAELRRFFCESTNMSFSELAPHLYEYGGIEAVRHLFRVAARLDSMVVGEPQILGQLKHAYLIAKAAGTVGHNLDQLLNHAFAVAKRVRSETSIGAFSVSVPSIAVDLVDRVFGSVMDRSVFLVGAGDMGELTARHLIKRGASAITVVNRTYERAVDLAARLNGSVIRFEDLEGECHRADIVICSTASPSAIFYREHGEMFLSRRDGRSMCFIDIAVPRDVAPEMESVDGIFVFNIDDLQEMALRHASERRSEADNAERIIGEEVEAFSSLGRKVEVVPTIVWLQQRFELVRQNETRRIRGVLASMTSEQRAAIERLTQSIVKKILHGPISTLKTGAKESAAASAIDTVRHMFSGEPDNPCAAPQELHCGNTECELISVQDEIQIDK